MGTGKITSLAMSAVATLFVVLLFACASVPSFHPSTPVDEAPTLPEGLLLCHEYHLPIEPQRPVALSPFLKCLDGLQEAFPAVAAGNASFRIFREEFHALYGTLRDQQWTPRLGFEIELAVHAILRSLWQLGLPSVTPMERELVHRHFPTTANRLGALSWEVVDEVVFDPTLERLKAGVISLGSGTPRSAFGPRGAQAVPPVDSAMMLELCDQVFALRSEVQYLSKLRRDQWDITKLAPQSAVSREVSDRYSAHLNAASRELQELRAKIGSHVLACRA